MTPKVYKAGEVCELLQVQPYVLRSWEKEFPGIGIQKSPETPRLYRQSDVEHVQRIKQLVFGEGLTVSGARRRLEASAPATSAASKSEAAEVLDALGADVRSRIAVVRDGLRELQSLLSGTPGSSNGHAARGKTTKRSVPKRSAAASRSKTVKRGAVRKTATATTRKQASPKRRRA